MSLIPVLLARGELETGQSGLDLLEEYAEGDDGIREVMQFLLAPANYDPAWSEQDALWALVQLSRRINDDEAAAGFLKRLFYRIRDSNADLASEIIDLFESWRLDPATVQSLRRALPAQRPEAAEGGLETRLRHGEPVTIVFVGGNEVQEKYDDRVRDGISSDYPGIELFFEHTGWSSNWGHQLPALVRKCNSADAVVLMTMMRTTLGCRLRAALKKPWISCVARGEMGLRRSVVKAAFVALRMKG